MGFAVELYFLHSDSKGEHSCHLWSQTWLCSLISQGDQFEAIYSLSADLHPIWCGLHIKHPTAKDNILIDLQHKGKSFNIWVNSKPTGIYFSFGSSQTNYPNGKILQNPLLSALISATTLKTLWDPS